MRAVATLALGVAGAVGTELWGVWFLAGCGLLGALLIGWGSSWHD